MNETGVNKKPSVFVVSKIAKALDVAIEELIKKFYGYSNKTLGKISI